MKYQNVYALFDCQLNTVDIDKLFSFYKNVNFIYPAKAKRLRQHWDEIVSNWKTAYDYGPELLRIVTHAGPQDAWGSITNWRHSTDGWTAQHLVSTSPLSSRCVMLAEQRAAMSDKNHGSAQYWFQSIKRLPNRVFGTVLNSIDQSHCDIKKYHYMSLPFKNFKYKFTNGVTVEKCNRNDILHLTTKNRGRMYSQTELNIDFNKVNDLYQRAGLFRDQTLFSARTPSSSSPVAALIAFRGPLGMNFSFMENRIDLIVDPNLNDEIRTKVISELFANAIELYSNFSPKALYVVCEEKDAECITQLGGSPMCKYTH